MTTLRHDVVLVSFSVVFLFPAAGKLHQHSIGRASRAAQWEDVNMQGSQHRQDKPFDVGRLHWQLKPVSGSCEIVFSRTTLGPRSGVPCSYVGAA